MPLRFPRMPRRPLLLFAALVLSVNFSFHSADASPRARPFCTTVFEKALTREEFGRALAAEISLENLFTPDRLSAPKAQRWNGEVLRFARELPFPKKSSRRGAITLVDAQEIVRRIDESPVTSPWSADKYDPSGEMGFCFGRAMAAHLEALSMNVDKDSILKLFAVGRFVTGESRWRYHVTTLIRAENGDWWAVDPFFGRPLPLGDWARGMQDLDEDRAMRLFLTEAKRFIPDSVEPYRRHILTDPGYRGYFTDLLWHFRNEAKKR